jgi:hypothetical protein
MTRLIAALFVISSLCLAGCEKPDEIPGPPPTGGGTAEPPTTDEPGPDQDQADDTTSETPAAEPGDTEPSAQGDGCPPAREPEGMCAQVMAWAKNPDTGKCCLYSTPCEAPRDWKTFGNEAECTGGE